MTCTTCNDLHVERMADCPLCGHYTSDATGCWFCLPYKARGFICLATCAACGETLDYADDPVIQAQITARHRLVQRYGHAGPRSLADFWESMEEEG